MASESETSSSDLKQRVVNLEHQNVRTLQDGNKRCSELETQVAHLRMLLEQNEVARRQSDLQAATVKGDAENQAMAHANEFAALLRSKQDAEAHLTFESDRAKEFEVGLTRLRAEHEERTAHFATVLQQREAELTAARERCTVATSETSSLESKLAEQTSLASTLQARVDRFSSDNMTQRETIAKQMEQLEMAIGQNQGLAAQAKEQAEELVELREKIEAERSSHLQSKFNCEVVQLRLRDVETSAKAERSARNEAAVNSNLLLEQLRDAKERLAEEQTTVRSLSQQLADCTTTCTTTEKTHKETLSRLQQAEQSLSKQLSRAKAECANAKTDKEKLESSITQLHQQLLTLIQHVEKSVQRSHSTLSKTRRVGLKKQPSRFTDSSTVTDADIDELVRSLATVVGGYEEKISKLSTTVSSLDAKLKTTSEQFDSHQHMATEADVALKKAQVRLKDLEGSLRNKSSTLADKDLQLRQTQSMADDLQRLLQEERGKLHAAELANAQVERLHAQQMVDAEEARSQQLHGLCLQLSLAARSSVASSKTKDGALSWKKLVHRLESDIGSTLGRIKSSDEKVKRLEATLQERDVDIKRLHQLHEESLAKVSAATSSREQAWQQQRDKQEKHMSELMKEVQAKIQDAHLMLSNTEAELQSVSQERDKYRHELATSQQTVGELNTCCLALRGTSALLTGCVWPLCVRLRCMTQALAITVAHSQRLEMAASLATQLADAVSEELAATSSSAGSSASLDSGAGVHRHASATRRTASVRLHPLLRFRKSAIAVLAFNRFRRVLHHTSVLCIVRDCPGGLGQRLPVWVCGAKASLDTHDTMPSSRAPADDGRAYQQNRQQKLSDWISFVRSPEFLAKMMASSEQLSALLQDLTGMQRGRKPSATLQLCARNQLSSVLRNVSAHFQATSLWSFDDQGHWSLLHALRDGLHHGLARIAKASSSHANFTVYQQHVSAMSTIQQHVINLANQLQKAEIQSHRHQQKVLELQQALKNANQQFSLTNKHLLSAERKASNLVPVERFDSVCTEMNAGLERERQQQVELARQRDELLQSKHRLDSVQAERRRLDTALQQAIQDLKDGHQAVHSTEGSLSLARQQCNGLQQQEAVLRARLSELQNSLVVTNREKTSLLAYLQAVNSAMETIQDSDLSGEDAAKILKSALSSARDKLQDGGDFTQCKMTLASMVEVLLSLASKLDARERDLALSATHIKTLRRELSSACRRQLSEATVQLAKSVVADDEDGFYGEVDLSKLGHFLGEQSSHSTGTSQATIPLRGQADRSSFSHRTRHTQLRDPTKNQTDNLDVQGLGADLSAKLSAAIASS
ncbi:coiled-coil domain-containing protein 171-like isoform X1 [Sycon ciliatum]|uniref:coiled-coil domain-containing protein 171-like isoform X1 n=1 Tax=Sycon ciliatum TaxID=27933 RepID=UPI0031F6A19D